MKKDDLFNIIDDLISMFRNATVFTIYDRAIYQMDGLLLSLMSKDNEIYRKPRTLAHARERNAFAVDQIR